VTSGAGSAVRCPPMVELVVVGAHLRGMLLHHELLALEAVFLRSGHTAPEYRLFALPAPGAPKPGLLRVGRARGARIEVEVFGLGHAAFGAFVAAIPAPLGIGKVRLDGAAAAPGFLVEAIAVEGAEDITGFGGWRAYRASLLPAS